MSFASSILDVVNFATGGVTPGRFASWLEPVPGTYSLTARPVFAVGKWNGEVYTRKDLAAIVEAFEPTLLQVKPLIKVGHDDDQKFAGHGEKKKSEGRPRLGSISRLYLNDEYQDRASGKTIPAGTQILADFVNIPEALYQPLVKMAYPERSVELLVNYRDADTGERWPLVLRAVAFLGDELPAVRGLSPLVELYSDSAAEVRTVNFSQGEREMAADTSVPAPAATPTDMGEIKALLQEVIGLLKAKKPEEDMKEDKAPEAAPDEKMAEEQPKAEAVPVVPAIPVPALVAAADEDTRRRIAHLEAEVKASKAAVTVMQQATEEKDRQAEARAFVESHSGEASNRIPAAKKEAAVYLIVNAPNGQTRTFSEGGAALSYADTLRGFMSGLPDRSGELGKPRTRALSASSAPSAAALADKARALAAEKKIDFADALTAIVQESGGDEFYTQIAHGGGD